ncbi:G1 family glutamic endopeptidase [Neobacillus sp. BF23-41]|uniref:G1 family glutamic endopeptidase n=1 Tax=Neobacillus sp. BF23-41 TaxID=3240280 RepID=UPI0034E53E8A
MPFTYNDCDTETKRQIDAINKSIQKINEEINFIEIERRAFANDMREAVGHEKEYIGREISKLFDKENVLRTKANDLFNEINQLLFNMCPRHEWIWSGYYLNATTYGAQGFNMIAAQWQVPNITFTGSNDTQSAFWIGISGESGNNGLIQIGTDAQFISGKPVFQAWFQLYGFSAPHFVQKPVQPGNIMRAHIRELRNNRWQLNLRNRTLGWGYTTIQTYTGDKKFAEFIVEMAPYGPTTSKILTNFGHVTFNNCRVNGMNPRFSSFQRVAMIPPPYTLQLATPSEPSNDGDGFTVAFGDQKPASPPN